MSGAWEAENFTVWWEESPLFTTIVATEGSDAQRVPKENVRHLTHLDEMCPDARYVVDDCENPQFLFDVEKQIYIKLSGFPKVYSDQNLQDFYASLANFLQQPNAGLRRPRGLSPTCTIPKTSEDELGVEYDPNFNLNRLSFYYSLGMSTCYDPFRREWMMHREAREMSDKRRSRARLYSLPYAVAQDWTTHATATIHAKERVNDETPTVFSASKTVTKARKIKISSPMTSSRELVASATMPSCSVSTAPRPHTSATRPASLALS